MVRRIGDDVERVTQRLIGADNPPKLLLISGATGTGKSTIAMRLAERLRFARVLSTDAIREIIRATAGEDAPTALNRSSFSRGEAVDPVLDWLDTCLAIEAGIEATIARARREGVDLLLEGVHLVPENRWLRQWREAGGIAVGVVLHVDNKDSHISMLRERESKTWRRAERYVAAIERLRGIQEGMLERCKISDWETVDPTLSEDPVERIEHFIDLEWNRFTRS